MLKKILAFVAIAYAAAATAFTHESAQVELDKVKDQLKSSEKTINPAQLLEMYAFYKQATVGDKPQDVVGGDMRRQAMAAKWASKQGMSIDAAVAGYKAIAMEILE
jgi:acyl-CoA-binding protein